MAKAHKINFGGVPEEIRSGSGRAAHVPPGDYLLKIVEAEFRKSEAKNSHYFSWRFQIVGPKKYKGKTVYDITSLKPDALWNLRNLIHAATGKNVAGKVLNFDPSKLYGKIIAATLEDDEYTKDNKTTVKSRPVDYRPKEELQAEDEDDDEETDDEEEEVEEEEEEDDLEEVDVDEL